jgi:hypothetical protein
LDSIKKSVLTQATGVSNELKAQTALLQSLTEQKRVADEAGNTSLIALIQNNIDATNRDIRGNNQVLSNIARDVAQIESDLNNALKQQSIANAGPPNDNSTTPPETVVPGQTNTDVTLPTLPPVQNFAPPTEPVIPAFPQRLATPPIVIQQQVLVDNTPLPPFTPPPIDNTVVSVVVPEPPPIVQNLVPETVQITGQNAAADAAFLEANASEQQVIDPNSDPNTNIGNDSQEQLPQPQQTISLASDPNTNIGAEGQIAPQKVPDEFDGIDAQIAANKAQADLDAVDAAIGAGTPQGISTALNDTRSQATKGDTTSSQQKKDWRAKLSLAPKANYLYKVPPEQAGILKPLQATDGVIFPYTPAISVTYAAGYDISELVHSNYKIYQYKGSSVDAVSITADFTAQDTTEATYLLAVIHFFRSVTKMFYGQDQNPKAGVPPPLCYLSGFGAYTFDAHPLVVTNFTYATPTDVDYIRAGSQTNQPGVNIAQQNTTVNTFVPSVSRIATNRLQKAPPNFQTQNSLINSEATYVPTKLQLQITCIPIVTRNDISNTFSLEKYATGQLLRGSKRSGGGIW